MKSRLFMSFLAGAAALCLASCTEETKKEVLPAISISDVAVSEDNVLTFKITSSDATGSAYMLKLKSETQPTAQEVVENGTSVKENGVAEVTVEELEPETEYVITAAAVSSDGLYASVTESLVSAKKKATLGDPANTYIVSSAGNHSFMSQKVDGTPIEIVSADWIWATKQKAEDTEQKLISNVSYKNGIVSFEHTGEKGNAVIAGFNEKGESVWTWLIWSTDTPEDIVVETGATFQDRALGATGATQESGKAAWAVINYQWGRPVPIFGGYEDEWADKGEVFNEARKWTVVNPKYPYQWGVEEKAVSMEESFASPLTFFVTIDSNNEYTWLTSMDKTLWKGGDKTNYDPCPAGYKQTQPSDWGDCIKRLESVMDGEEFLGGNYTYNGKTLWFPVSGCGRNCDTGENVRGFMGQFMFYNGTCSEFWPYGIPGMGDPTTFPSRILVDLKNAMMCNNNVAANATFAHAVRCVKI